MIHRTRRFISQRSYHEQLQYQVESRGNVCYLGLILKTSFQKVQNQPGQIETPDLASILTPKSHLNK